jgi:Delta3-Delta2-enoyl-CoA isomerase
MSESIVSVSYTLNNALAIVSIHREPVNSMNTGLWTVLLQTLDNLEQNPHVRGVVFTSALQRNVFTAGNDITELYAPSTSMAQFANFWITSNTFLARVYTSPLLTIATVKGACPAGGCALAMCCDYRVVTADASMGLNEVAIGIIVPEKWIRVMIGIIGQGPTEKLTAYARMIKADEALKIGFVDAVVPDAAALQGAAEKIAMQVFKLPDYGRALTKDLIRGELGRSWIDTDYLENDAHKVWSFLTQESTVKTLKGVMAGLSKSKGKSKL